MSDISPITQAVLLLTSNLGQPLDKQPAKPLTPGEYNKVAVQLRALKAQPSDLLGAKAAELAQQCGSLIEPERMQMLLGRGFMLSNASERWGQRAIWVISRSDPAYPKRLKNRLKKQAPVLLFGCGNSDLLHREGGLAVVGSRNIDDDALTFTQRAGALAAKAGRLLVSGGARGVDSAAMQGATDADGEVCGVLADSLEKVCMKRENRNAIREGRLLLVSPFEPNARFHVGPAMQRNKVIYGLSDAALVISATYNKGGTWEGAIEQLTKHQFLPVYVRADKPLDKGLKALCDKGARLWPQAPTVDDLIDLYAAAAINDSAMPQGDMFAAAPAVAPEQAADQQIVDAQHSPPPASTDEGHVEPSAAPDSSIKVLAQQRPADTSTMPVNSADPAETLWQCVVNLLSDVLVEPVTDKQFAQALNITPAQARDWLKRLVDEGRIEKLTRPVRYQLTAAEPKSTDNRSGER